MTEQEFYKELLDIQETLDKTGDFVNARVNLDNLENIVLELNPHIQRLLETEEFQEFKNYVLTHTCVRGGTFSTFNYDQNLLESILKLDHGQLSDYFGTFKWDHETGGLDIRPFSTNIFDGLSDGDDTDLYDGIF